MTGSSGWKEVSQRPAEARNAGFRLCSCRFHIGNFQQGKLELPEQAGWLPSCAPRLRRLDRQVSRTYACLLQSFIRVSSFRKSAACSFNCSDRIAPNSSPVTFETTSDTRPIFTQMYKVKTQ